jgi:hypothetical protein
MSTDLAPSGASSPSITVTHNIDFIKVYLNNVLHVHIPRKFFRGLQSWVWKGKFYCIEFSLSDVDPIVVEYDSREVWQEVLIKINGAL